MYRPMTETIIMLKTMMRLSLEAGIMEELLVLVIHDWIEIYLTNAMLLHMRVNAS